MLIPLIRICDCHLFIVSIINISFISAVTPPPTNQYVINIVAGSGGSVSPFGKQTITPSSSSNLYKILSPILFDSFLQIHIYR